MNEKNFLNPPSAKAEKIAKGINESTSEAKQALNFVRRKITRVRKVRHLSPEQEFIFVRIWDNPNVQYKNMVETLDILERSVGSSARSMFTRIEQALTQTGKIDKATLKSAVTLSMVEESNSNNFLTNYINKNTTTFPSANLLSQNQNNSIATEITLDRPVFDRYFYIERSNEEEAFKELNKPAGLIKIEGTKNVGKTLLIARLLDRLSDSTYGVEIDLNLACDRRKDPNDFLLWICRFVTKKLGLRVPSGDSWDKLWDEDLGGIVNADSYFEKYLLKLEQIDRPVILAFDNFRSIFEYENSAIEAFKLFRYWSESRTFRLNSRVAQKLRLIVAYRENPIQIDGPNSPFNVGIPIGLNEFNVSETLQLARKYQLPWQEKDAKKAIGVLKESLIVEALKEDTNEETVKKVVADSPGGNPYLIRSICDELKSQNNSLEDFLESNFQIREPYKSYFKETAQKIQKKAKARRIKPS